MPRGYEHDLLVEFNFIPVLKRKGTLVLASYEINNGGSVARLEQLSASF